MKRTDDDPTCKDCVHFHVVDDPRGPFCTFNPRWVQVSERHFCGQLEPTRKWLNG